MRYGLGRETAVKTIIGVSILLSGISFLSPFYKLPDVYLFGVFLLYMVAYLTASLCIVYTMKLSLRIRKNTERLGWQWLKDLIRGNVNLFSIIRKSPRYHVQLAVECRESERALTFSGNILNISNGGFMACLPELDCLLDRVVAKITFPMEKEPLTVELPAEHLWFTEEGKRYFHGFRFLEFDGQQKEVVFRFLVKYKVEE
jgi:hypothetical protein